MYRPKTFGFCSSVTFPMTPCFNCLLRDFLALKWLRPDFRAMTLPRLVTLTRFENALLVLPCLKFTLMLFFCSFYNYHQTFWALFRPVGNLVLLCDEVKRSFEAFLLELSIEVFSSSSQVQLNLYSVAFPQRL